MKRIWIPFTLLCAAALSGIIIYYKKINEELHQEKISQISPKILLCDEARIKAILQTFPPKQLEKMHKAAQKIKKWQRILKKTGATPLTGIFKGRPFMQKQHYPKGDVVDKEHKSHYYFHAHRENEQGHFHLFYHDLKENELTEDNFIHLGALSIDHEGMPKTIFATNQWVTGGKWAEAEILFPLLQAFSIEHSYPDWISNRWLSAMTEIFYPQFILLLKERDRILSGQKKALSDLSWEVIVEIPISLEDQLQLIEEGLANPKEPTSSL